MQYYTQEVKPVQDELLTQFPQVALEAKMGRIALDTASLLVNGIIPPERLPEYKAYLDGPFRHMRSTWDFRDVEGGCEVEFFVDFEFRNKAFEKLAGLGEVAFADSRDRPMTVLSAHEIQVLSTNGVRLQGRPLK